MRHQPVSRFDKRARKQPLTHAVSQKLSSELMNRNISFREIEIKLGISTGAISKIAAMNLTGRNFVYVNLEDIENVVLYLGYESLGRFIIEAESEVRNAT